MKPKMNLHELCEAHGLPTIEPAGGPRCFRIIRYFYNGRPKRTIRAHVTETEARAHCSRPDTKCKGVWFDGYDYMKGCRP